MVKAFPIHCLPESCPISTQCLAQCVRRLQCLQCVSEAGEEEAHSLSSSNWVLTLELALSKLPNHMNSICWTFHIDHEDPSRVHIFPAASPRDGESGIPCQSSGKLTPFRSRPRNGETFTLAQ